MDTRLDFSDVDSPLAQGSVGMAQAPSPPPSPALRLTHPAEIKQIEDTAVLRSVYPSVLGYGEAGMNPHICHIPHAPSDKSFLRETALEPES